MHGSSGPFIYQILVDKSNEASESHTAACVVPRTGQRTRSGHFLLDLSGEFYQITFASVAMQLPSVSQWLCKKIWPFCRSVGSHVDTIHVYAMRSERAKRAEKASWGKRSSKRAFSPGMPHPLLT